MAVRTMLSVFVSVAVLQSVTATKPLSRKEVLSRTTIPEAYDLRNPYDALPPVGVDPAFDCGWRTAAYQYAKKIATVSTNLSGVSDALQLSMCNVTLDHVDQSMTAYPVPTTGHVVYVDPIKGSDSAAGTIDAPLATIDSALSHVLSAGGANNTVVLRAGTHRVVKTINIGPEHVNLTIQAYPGEAAWVSGAVKINPQWSPAPQPSTPPKWLQYNNTNAVYALQCSPPVPGKVFCPPAVFLGKPDTADACEALCKNAAACTMWTWHDGQQGEFANMCVTRTDNAWSVTAEGGHTSGRKVGGPQPNLFVADLSSENIEDITGIRVDGQRAWRARYPNVPSIETSLFPTGWITNNNGAVSWTKPTLPAEPEINIEVAEPNRSVMMNEFQRFELGVRGCCNNFDPPEGYWCSDKTSGGGAFTYKIPSGITFNQSTLPNCPYKNPTDAVVQAFRPGHWASWMFEVDNFTTAANAQTVGWTKGGFQGARGSDTGAEWFIENVMEELDSPMEYFYDKVSKKLYFRANSSDQQHASFEVTALQDIIIVAGLAPTRGTHRQPVRGFRLLGVGVKDSALTYFEPHSIPSGGDWGLQRMGAVFLENTESSVIEGCTFSRNDGIAVMVSGYNRHTTIRNSEFVWNGETAMAGWGYTDNMDGTSGEQPRMTLIEGNYCHELGHFEKQSSCWFQAKTALTTIQHNIMFNGPRALVNYNDGFGGGNVLQNNLMFNANRETSDHGPFNSWDRQPYLTDVLDGTPSLIPAANVIYKNFMVANYGSNGGCVDNDDGSSFYNISENFFVFGGHKSDFNGHSKLSWGNVNVYPSVYGTKCVGVFGLPNPDPQNRWNEGYWNNSCILPDSGDPYIDITGPCTLDKATFTVTLGDNRVYATNKNATVQCGKKMSFEEFSAAGLDVGSTINEMITTPEIIQMGKDLLGW